MNKKIGLLTFHRTTNFGSILQTYGLYKAISNLGYNCEIIDYRCPSIEKRESLKPEISILKPKEIIKLILFQPAINRKAQELINFTMNRMNLSNTYYPENIKEADDKYNKIFVGSDIVWGRDITEDDLNYFLEFVSDKKRKYSFASSVGNYDIRGDEEKISSLLQDFSQIAVREDSAVEWVKNISGMEASLVCDPTMLLTAEEWEKEVPTKKMHDSYILVYFNNEDGKCLDDAIKYAKKTNKKVYFINYYKPKKNVINIKPKTINEFLSLIKYADLVMTASYHGILFSLYYNKELMFYTRAHKSRVLSLSKKLGIFDHCGDNWDINSYKELNYKEINSRVQNFRKESLDILNEMLDK